MEIKDKASILVEFIQVNFTNDRFTDFFDYNDLGLPLAVAFENDLCTLNDKGIEVLNETYDLMLEEYGVDKDKDYEVLDDIIEDSKEA